MKRTASAIWNGGLKGGKGSLTTESGVLSATQYSFSTRFENGVGTNPEELIAAAHAGCFTMDLSSRLENAKFPPERIDTVATLTMEKTELGFTIAAMHLDVSATVPRATAAVFNEAVAAAKAGCPVSRLLKAEISVDASLKT